MPKWIMAKFHFHIMSSPTRYFAFLHIWVFLNRIICEATNMVALHGHHNSRRHHIQRSRIHVDWRWKQPQRVSSDFVPWLGLDTLPMFILWHDLKNTRINCIYHVSTAGINFNIYPLDLQLILIKANNYCYC